MAKGRSRKTRDHRALTKIVNPHQMQINRSINDSVAKLTSYSILTFENKAGVVELTFGFVWKQGKERFDFEIV